VGEGGRGCREPEGDVEGREEPSEVLVDPDSTLVLVGTEGADEVGVEEEVEVASTVEARLRVGRELGERLLETLGFLFRFLLAFFFFPFVTASNASSTTAATSAATPVVMPSRSDLGSASSGTDDEAKAEGESTE
jgi:hypothetical protein